MGGQAWFPQRARGLQSARFDRAPKPRIGVGDYAAKRGSGWFRAVCSRSLFEVTMASRRLFCRSAASRAGRQRWDEQQALARKLICGITASLKTGSKDRVCYSPPGR
jgi:hypothetical protein